MIEITEQQNTSKLAQIFKALSNENRLKIFNLIRQCVNDGCCTLEFSGEKNICVCDIGDHMELALSTVSHHLKELRNAGLITCEKRGQWVYCTINPDALGVINGFLDEAS